MDNIFYKVMDRVLLSEGNYSDDKDDPGNWTGGKVGVGELKGTKFGIAANTYPNIDIKNLTRDAAVAIYKTDFFEKICGAELNEDLVYLVMDFAVNSGVETAIRYLQRAAGVADDGHLGPVSLAAIKDMPIAVIQLMYLSLRLNYMTKLKNWPHAGKGWARRIADNMLYAAEDLLT